VVDARRSAALVQVELRDHARNHGHARAEFERHADGVARLQRAALVRHVGPIGVAAFALEEALEPIRSCSR